MAALAPLLSTKAENIDLVFVNLGPQETVALMANTSIRSLSREYQLSTQIDYGHLYALAAHPTLRSLRVVPEETNAFSSLKRGQYAKLYAVWAAGKKPASALILDV